MSFNEWDQLKKVIVGVADNAQVPDIDISLRCVNYADKVNEAEIITRDKIKTFHIILTGLIEKTKYIKL